VSAIAKIAAKLSAYPDVRHAVEGTGAVRTITVLPGAEDGFAVRLTESRGHWTVGYEGWHEEFDDEDAALECFAFGLSAACRLRVEYRGRMPVKWTVEALSEGAWVEDSTTGLIHPFFWRRPRVQYRQNRVVPADTARPPSGRTT
jgi:hypothetical protein